MEKDIKVSVILPVYNMQDYLRQCLDSVLTQTLQGIEIICVNDGSTDRSGEILNEYEAKYHITVINQRNQGSGPARNVGIDKAIGKYIAFMDPDDYYADCKALEILYYYAEREQILICGGNVKNIDGEYCECYFDNTQKMEFQNLRMAGSHWRYIYNREFLRENRIRYPNYRRFQDPPFSVKAMILAKTFYAVNTDVYVYRTNHKKLDYDEKVAINVIHGLRDIFEIVKQNGFDSTCAKQILEKNMGGILRHASQGKEEVLKALNELNNFIFDVLGDEYVISKGMLEDYREECDKLFQIIWNKEPIFIYGAGKIGKLAVQSLDELQANIQGILVTNKDNNSDMIGKYKITEIDSYIKNSNEANILIAVGINYQEEIKRTLDMYGLKKIYVWQYDIMEYIRDVKKDNIFIKIFNK